MVVDKMGAQAQRTADNLNPRDNTLPLVKQHQEIVRTEEGPTKVTETNIGSSFILGHPQNGTLGTNTDTVSGNQNVLGRSDTTETLVAVVNPDGIFRESLAWDTYVGTDSSTCSTDVTGQYLTFDNAEVLQSESIAYDNGTITKATLFLEDEQFAIQPSFWFTFNENTTDHGFGGLSWTPTDITYDDGKVGGSAADFNGSSSKIEATANATFNALTDFSFSCWIKFDSFHNGLLLLLSDGVNDQIRLGVNASHTFTLLNDVNNANEALTSGGKTSLAGEWIHILVVYPSDGTAKMYLNGSQEGATASFSNGISGLDDGFTVGIGNFSTIYYNGVMDDPRFFDFELSAAQIAELYNSGAGTPKPLSSSNYAAALRADGSNWENVTINEEHSFTNTGTDLSYKFTASTDSTVLYAKYPDGLEPGIKIVYE